MDGLPTENWRRPIARLIGQKGICGAGVLAAPGHVVTCAHVVRGALAAGSQPECGKSEISLDFPFAGLGERKATLVAWYPEDASKDVTLADLAVLLIDGPPGVAPCPPVPHNRPPRADMQFEAWGFPVKYDGGARAEGRMRETDGDRGWLDVVADSELGHFIEPGFSGAPLFERGPKGVTQTAMLGIAVTADPSSRRVARVIPAAQVAAATLPYHTAPCSPPQPRTEFFSWPERAY